MRQTKISENFSLDDFIFPMDALLMGGEFLEAQLKAIYHDAIIGRVSKLAIGILQPLRDIMQCDIQVLRGYIDIGLCAAYMDQKGPLAMDVEKHSSGRVVKVVVPNYQKIDFVYKGYRYTNNFYPGNYILYWIAAKRYDNLPFESIKLGPTLCRTSQHMPAWVEFEVPMSGETPKRKIIPSIPPNAIDIGFEAIERG